MKKTFLAAAALLAFIPLRAATVDGICGFATQNGGTTGGAGGEVVTVTTLAELQNAVRDADSTPRTVYINAPEINSGDDKGMQIRLGSNKTIIGCGSGTFMNGVLFGINGKTNIIIRNLKFSMVSITNTTDPAVYDPDGDEGRPQIIVNGGDCIGIQGASSNIWIDHCEFYQVDPHVQTNQDLYDGLIDIKNASQYVTISWCYFHDHHKCHLVGSSDSDNYDRKITFHHNYYYNIKERMPSYRFGTAHIFNNYYLDILSSGANSRMGACLRIENNYFEDSIDPIVTKNSTTNGNWDLHNSMNGADGSNVYMNCTGNRPVTSNCSLNLTYAYSSFLDAAADAKAIVLANAGIGKINTGCGAPQATPTRTRTRTQTPVVPTLTRTPTRTNTPVFTKTNTATNTVIHSPTYTSTSPATFTRTRTATATLTASPVPAGYQEIQLENACSMEGVVESEHAGYTGTGYANLDNVTGSAITFSLASASAQAVSLDFRYASGSETNRSMSLSVNGVIQIVSLSFPGTGAWTTWGVSTAVIMLAPGYNTVTLASLTAEGAPNFDMVSFSSTEITDGSCVPASTETVTVSSTESRVPSSTPTATYSVTRTPSPVPSMTATPTASGTVVFSPTLTLTSNLSPTYTATVTLTASGTVVFSPTLTLTSNLSPTYTATGTLTVTPLNTLTATATVSSTATVTLTSTPLPTGTETFTRTFTGTATPTVTGTRTPSRTATVTITATQTASSTPAATATATNVLTGVFAINDFFTYPNPYKTENGDIYLSFDAPVQAQNCELRVYTAAFRKVLSEPLPGIFYGHSIARVDAWKLQGLSAGIYYAVLEADDAADNAAKSGIVPLIIIR